MKKNFKLIMFAAAAVAMIGCAKDGGKTPTTQPTGVKTYATVEVAQTSSPVSRAIPPTDWSDATANESTLHDVKLYVFNDNKQLEQVVTIPIVEKSATFETVNGPHTLIVLANSPAAVTGATLVSLKDIESGATGPATLYSEFLSATKIAYADQAAFEAAVISAADKFFITNIDTPVVVDFLVPTDSEPNPNADIDIAIGRAFAKLNASWANTVQPANDDSEISKMEYIVLHNPKTMYAPQHFDNGTYKSYYHDAGYVAANYYDWAGTAWKLADASASTYVPENTNKQVILEGERTALGFRASFEPDPCYKSTLNSSNNSFQNETYGAGNSFWRIKDLRNGVSSWVKGVYFNAKPEVAAAKKALGIALADANPVEGTDYACYEYENGYCYYYLGLERPTGTAPAKYNVARNDYFWVSVDTVADCGEPTLDEATPDPTTPVSVSVNITAKISLKPWNPVIQSGNL